MKRRLLSIIISMAMAVSLTACGNSGTSSAETDKSGKTEQKTENTDTKADEQRSSHIRNDRSNQLDIRPAKRFINCHIVPLRYHPIVRHHKAVCD